APRAHADEASPTIAPLVSRLASLREPSGTSAIFGVALEDAERVFAHVCQTQALPPGFVPPDLVRLRGVPRVSGQPVSVAVMPDLESMVAQAQMDNVDIAVLSAYRSFSEQEIIFEQNVQRSMYRTGVTLSREDAEQAAERFSARPGHSQHQLGTAIDFTTAEIGYGLGARFAETQAGQWLIEHSWRFGFIFPYTDAAELRSGYRNEPWHVRWVGRQLAEIMHNDGYLSSRFPIADDYVLAVAQLLSDGSVNP
ncbi:MAG TPA: M15 family metallopeptidase, partial [Chloroflexota bacterium]|nr:M15 family metallopeptidase [Chloroflexota bacterium]